MRKNKNGAVVSPGSLNQMIQKIIFYRKKNLVLFFLLLLVSMLLIASYLLYDYADRAMKKSDGERLYGTYDICVLAENSEMEDTILENQKIQNALKVKKWMCDWDGGETATWYGIGDETTIISENNMKSDSGEVSELDSGEDSAPDSRINSLDDTEFGSMSELSVEQPGFMSSDTGNDSTVISTNDPFDQFFSMTNYEFVAGRYPTQAGELLCEDEFLSLNGYYFDRDGEVDVEINGATWHVTGTFAENESLRDAYEVYSPTFLTIREGEETEQGAETWLYLDVGNAVTGEVMEEIREACKNILSAGNMSEEDNENEYEENLPKMYTNVHYLDSAKLDSYGNTTLPWLKLQQILGYVVVVLLWYLLTQVAWLSLKEKKHDFAVLMSHGVTPGKITGQYGQILLMAVFVDMAVVLAVSFLYFVILTGGWKFQAFFANGGISNILSSDGVTSSISAWLTDSANLSVSAPDNPYADVPFLAGACRILAADGIFSVLVTVFVLIRCHHLLSANIGGSISATLANRDNIRAKSPKRKRKPQRIFDGEPRLIPPLADNMMRKKRGAYRLFSVAIILGLLMIDLYSYVAGEILPKDYVTDYDYRVKYIYNTGQEIMLGIEGMDETYESIQDSGLADLLPLFCVKTRLNFRVTDLEKTCQDYLKNSDDYVAQELSAGRASADVDCIVLGVDAEILEKLCGIRTESIADTDCYVLAGIEEESGRTIRLGLEEGSVIRITDGVTVEFGNISDTGEVIYELTVRQVADSISAMQDDFCGKPVVMVSMPVYEALAYENFTYTYPTWIYLNCADGVSDTELTDYFRSLSNILLVDNASEVRSEKRIWFQTMVPVYFMGGCLLVSLLVNVYIALNSSYEENRSQLAMLSALGVNERGLISLQLRLNWRVFFRSTVLGNALAVGVCYLIFRLLIEYDSYAEFLPPYGIMTITTTLVTAIFLGVSVVMRRKIRSMNMVEELSAEAS